MLARSMNSGDDQARGATGKTSWLLVGLAVATAIASAAAFPFDQEVSRAAMELKPTQPAAFMAYLAIKSLGKGDMLIFALLLCCLTRMRQPAVQGLVGLALIALPVMFIKLAVDRSRPAHAGDSFPSGDTASVVVALVPMAMAAPVLWLPVAALIVLVAGFRMVDGNHYPSDVLAGASLGFLADFLALKYAPRKWLRPRKRVIYWLLGPALIVCVIVTATSGGETPLKGFVLLVLPLLLIGVLLERRRLVRIMRARM